MSHGMKLSKIARALVSSEFTFFYQPIISLFTGHICGAESLLRWIQPDGKVILPGDFIPLAEETGFITEITHEMLPRAVEGLDTINEIDDSLFVSFNVSAKDFADKTFISHLHKTTAERIKKVSNFCIEITETSFLPSDPATQKILHKITDQGLSIILNDFSAGYTSFATLTQLPLKAIKVAMNVTQQAPHGRKDFRLFRHLVSMAHQLNLSIIAEGVEDRETHTLMAAVGCTHSQGYYYARPMPLPNFLELLEKKPAWLDYPFGLEYLAQFDHIDFRRDVIRASLMIFKNRDKGIQERALARLPDLDHSTCGFGNWYDQIEPLNRGDESFKQLGTEHKEFHEIARSLIEIAKAGDNFEDLEKNIFRFSNKSKIILDLIQEMEIRKLQEYFLSSE